MQANDEKLVREWARITVDRWQEKMRKLKIADSGRLMQSFMHTVIHNAEGDISKIDFAFEYYGKFVDMGVGKGVKIEDVKELGMSRREDGRRTGNRRRPKKWFNKTFYAEMMKLKELTQDRLATSISTEIASSFSDEE